MNRNNSRHYRESGNPERYWIPGQARNDKLSETYVGMYSYRRLAPGNRKPRLMVLLIAES